MRRYKAQGVHSIKQYLQPRRIQRQWVLQAAIAEGINVTNEGAADLRMDVTMAVDGFAAIEHSIGQVPLYKDVVTVLADARLAYHPRPSSSHMGRRLETASGAHGRTWTTTPRSPTSLPPKFWHVRPGGGP